MSGSGVGGAAVLNQDNSVNTPAHPAARGTIIQVFTTGGAPEKVTIGGIDAAIAYTGPAPDAVRGLVQVNAVIPTSVTPGDAVALVVSIGAAQSPPSATIAVN